MRGLALASRLASAPAPSPRRLSAAVQRAAVVQAPPAMPASAARAGGAAATPGSAIPEQPLVLDTYRMVRALEAAGLPERASAAVSGALVDVSQAAQRQAAAHGVTKSEFVALRSELSILEKADFAVLKADIVALEKRLDTAVAEIYTAVERVENRVIKWVVAVAGALTLGILRVTAFAPQQQQPPPPPPALPVAEAEHRRPRDPPDGPRIRLVHV